MMRARWIALGFAALAVLAGCDDVTEAERGVLIGEIQGHVRSLDLANRSDGFYTPHPEKAVRYVKLPHSSSGASRHGVSIWIIQDDREDKTAERAPLGQRPAVSGRPGVTDSRQVFRHPPEFFQNLICPPDAMVAPYRDKFDIYINLFSVKFDQQFRIPCL